MRPCEYKKEYDPTLGRHVYKHIFGMGILDSIKDIGRRLVGKTVRDTAKKAASNVAKKGIKTAAKKTGTYLGEKGGDRIIQLLHKKNDGSNKISYTAPDEMNPVQQVQMSQREIDERVNQILGSGPRRRQLSNLII